MHTTRFVCSGHPKRGAPSTVWPGHPPCDCLRRKKGCYCLLKCQPYQLENPSERIPFELPAACPCPSEDWDLLVVPCILEGNPVLALPQPPGTECAARCLLRCLPALPRSVHLVWGPQTQKRSALFRQKQHQPVLRPAVESIITNFPFATQPLLFCDAMLMAVVLPSLRCGGTSSCGRLQGSQRKGFQGLGFRV